MVTKQVALETVRAFIRECKASGLPIEKALVFGSYAIGTPHEGSDIDLLMISSRFTENVFENLKLYSKINIRYPIIETHPYPISILRDGDDFVEEISKNGVLVD